MKKYKLSLALSLCSVIACAQAMPSATPTLSRAGLSITQAKKTIDAQPQNVGAYNALAMALARRARETSDVSFYVQAEEALKKSFELAPDNFEGQKARTWVLLGQHEFSAALNSAKALNKRAPDDVLVYGFLTDANVELGNYKEAEAAAQWMLDLRPGNLPALTRAAYLRELFGDIDGATELMNMAYSQVAASELEDRAWILAQLAHLELLVGRAEPAEKLLESALQLFPDYHYALANLAKVRQLQKRHSDAAELLRRRYKHAPHAENLYALAEAMELAGKYQEAKTAFAEFEQKSLRESNLADNSNHELVFYYADYAHKPAEALRIARMEMRRRQDVHTLDALAWALHVNGEYTEARRSMEKALSIGVRDAKFFYHAGEIAWGSGDKVSAIRYWKDSRNLNSLGSESAAKVLARLTNEKAGQ